MVISTGAAPGYFAMRFAKWLGRRTIWIDSIANVEQPVDDRANWSGRTRTCG